MRGSATAARAYLVVSTLFLLVSQGIGPAQAATPAEELRMLVERGQAQEAYARGRRYPDQLGDPAFDFYYGVAAIDAGHPGEGTLALERYVITYPNNLNARLELARGYFMMGEDGRAREEFDGVLKANPPASVRANIAKFEEAIKAREDRYRIRLTGYAEAGYGYDSNVNGGVSSSNISLPIFGPVVVAPAGVKTDDGFSMAGAGGQINVPLTQRWSAFVGASIDSRFYHRLDVFDQLNLTGFGGALWQKDRNLIRVSLSATELRLDSERFRDIFGGTGEWYHQLSESWTANVFGQYARIAYTGTNAVRDADFYSVGAGLRKVFSGAWSPTLNATLNLGREANIRDRDDLGRDLYGGRLTLSLKPAAKVGFYAAASAQRSEYLEPDAFLATRRRDLYAAIEAGGSYNFTDALSLRLDLITSRNDSNLELYRYARNVALLKLRYDHR
ncbi:MAG: hypothetical protein K2Y35_08265 [Burkholderiales bacterium]|nr:hypothetical protein [Burkholderiales bacterium]